MALESPENIRHTLGVRHGMPGDGVRELETATLACETELHHFSQAWTE
jgi:hypothetical protein